MMNLQNPALYPPQQAYGYGAGMPQPQMQPSYPNDPSQAQFQQPGPFPTTPQRQVQGQGQFQQAGGQLPPHIYQQLQQQQQQQAFARSQGQGNNGFVPGMVGNMFNDRANNTGHQPRQPSANGQTPNAIPRTNVQQVNNLQTPNMAMPGQMQRPMVNQGLPQQAQGQNTAQANKPVQQPSTPLSPQSASREKARVAVLLEINAHLLQEVVTLQEQGKAGATVQQSPTSPNPATENFNSPIDGTKSGPSKEYQECMRRLQANLSYLAAVADQKKRPDGKIPPHPAIINPPPHLTKIHDLYKKLNILFPEASQSAMNKAIAYASAQHSGQPNSGEQVLSQTPSTNHG